MTRELAIQILEAQKDNGDTEIAHGVADSVICELLETLGYEDVVEAYNKVDMWYA
jgi:hypothetical protein